jgi:acetyl esterase
MPPRPPAVVERAVARAFLRLPDPVLRRIVGPPVRSPEGFVLDLQMQAILWLARQAHVPEMEEGTLAQVRANSERGARIFAVAGIHDVDARDVRVRGGAGELAARAYTPRGGRRPSPGLVWFHGGGFVFGSIASHHAMCLALASLARVVVVSVGYRLAPESPFPAATDDAVAATRSILTRAADFGIDPRSVAVGGDSAGGSLSAVVSQALRADALRPAFQLLVYPATDCRRGAPSHARFREGFFLTQAAIDWFMGHYLPDPASILDPRASPLLSPDVSGVAPGLVITAGFDPLRDEGTAYAERMNDAGVQVESWCCEGMLHGFFSMAGSSKEARRVFVRAADRMRVALGACL